jgi:RNA recognition motif-containing protein
MNIYVSNIAYTATDEGLTEAFAVHGTVESARIIRDRLSGRSRGFGFVEMPSEEEGKKAVEALNGTEFLGRPISVREARPKEEGKEGAPSTGSGQTAHKPRAEKPKEPEIVVIQRGMY